MDEIFKVNIPKTYTEKEYNDVLLESKNNYDKYIRSVADFQNYKRITEKKEKDMVYLANNKVLTEILPIIDELERAYQNGNKDIYPIYKLGISILNKFGVEQYGNCGDIFDYNIHSAISTVFDQEKEINSIVDVYKHGYKFNDNNILRYAEVIVNKEN